MKCLFFCLILLPGLLRAKSVVLVSYYDPFGGAKFNNSEKVAKRLELAFQHSEIEIRVCALQTVFDKSYAQFEECMKTLSAPPALIIGLGESNCNLKLETIVRNLDKTNGPDNEGHERDKTVIISEAESELGLNYPLAQMYCGLSENEREKMEVSNNVGSFVCNNTAFKISHYYPEIPSGFMHVPSNNCWGLDKKTDFAVKGLEAMITTAIGYLAKENLTQRLPTKKKELEELRVKFNKKDKCLYDFFKRSRGVDEKGFWPF